ncbi:MAG: hypothetical protein AAGF47_01015 [Planctomycetota bacterium]
MRALLIADLDAALREAPLLRRLTIGLLDAGVRVSLALPRSTVDRADPPLGVQVLPYRTGGAIWTRSLRAGELLDRFLEHTLAGEGQPTIVHAFGPGCMAFAAAVARLGGFALAAEVSSRQSLAPGLDATARVPRHALLAASSALGSACIAGGADPATVRARPWSVTMPKHERGWNQTDRAVSIAIGGAGRSASAWAAALRGVAAVAARHDQLAVFVDAEAASRAGIGDLVGSAGLTPILSRVPDFEGSRSLVVRCDLFLWPERLGETRSIVLDAAHAGAAVLAVEDPDVAGLERQGLAELVGPASDGWANAVGRLVDSVEHRRERAEQAAGVISAQHRSAAYVSGVVEAYEWCAEPAPTTPSDSA